MKGPESAVAGSQGHTGFGGDDEEPAVRVAGRLSHIPAHCVNIPELGEHQFLPFNCAKLCGCKLKTMKKRD